MQLRTPLKHAIQYLLRIGILTLISLLAVRWTTTVTYAQDFTSLHHFIGPQNGIYPFSALIKGKDGCLYGTTVAGGVNDAGTLFKVQPDGTGYQTLHTFSGGNSGRDPVAVIQGADGALYGTTMYAGTFDPITGSDYGTVFKMNLDGTGFQIIHTFSGGVGGGNPAAAMLQSADGVLYGTTYYGGTSGSGTVYKVNPDGTGFQILYSLGGSTSDGRNPAAALLQGADGVLYGTTYYGGTSGSGTLFKVKPDGTGFQTLHAFSGSDGANPNAAVIQGTDGMLYGTTQVSGTNGFGTLFKVNSNGTGFQTVYTFTSSSGGYISAAVIQGKDAALYGTTLHGGASKSGTLFKVNTNGVGFQTLHAFNGSDGSNPPAALLQDADGTLYGPAEYSGTNNAGTLFKLKPDGTAFQTLHVFNGSDSDGRNPAAALLQGADGALYGTTSGGGANNVGTLFKLNPDGTNFQTLHAFGYSVSDGNRPEAAVIQDMNGVLYGTTYYGGIMGYGIVFKLNPDGTGFQALHEFSDSDGANPNAAVIRGTDGALYGTTFYGGTNHAGTLFKVNPDGTGFRALHLFAMNDSNGSNPNASMLVGNDGMLYGTTEFGGMNGGGVLFKVNPDGTGFQPLYALVNFPSAVILGLDGIFYGATQLGGMDNAGILFKVKPDGTGFQMIHAFSGSEGKHPIASMHQGVDGALYGTTSGGGANNVGTLFKLNPDGTDFQILHDFNGSDGSGLITAIIQGMDGAFYGATVSGGKYGLGTLFRLSLAPRLTGVSVAPMSVIGGTQNAIGTAMLSRAAPTGGAVITLTSSNTNVATVPSSITIPAGSTSATFTVTSLAVTTTTDTTLMASYGNVNQTTTLTVSPSPSPVSLTILSVSPVSVVGGQQNPTGTVTLSGPAPLNGIVVTLSSSNAGAATVPANVTVPAGSKTATFTATSKKVPTNVTTRLTATYNGVKQQVVLTVLPVPRPAVVLSSVSVSPVSVVGGQQNPTGTVTLSGPAPTGGAVVILSSSNTGAATVPANVTVPAGSKTATFTVTSKKVPAIVTTHLTATYNGSKQQVVLTVTH